MLVGHLLFSPAMLYEAVLVVNELIAVQVVSRINRMDVRHPDATQRRQVVIGVETLYHTLLDLDVFGGVFQLLLRSMFTEIYWCPP